MNKKQIPVRGGGVILAKNLTKTRQVIDKNGNVVEEVVTKPGEPRPMRPMKGLRERTR